MNADSVIAVFVSLDASVPFFYFLLSYHRALAAITLETSQLESVSFTTISLFFS